MSKSTKPLFTIRKTNEQQLINHLFNSLQQQLQIVLRDTEYEVGEIIPQGVGGFDQQIKWGEKNSGKLDRTIDITVRKEIAESTGYGSTNRYDLVFNCSHDGTPIVGLCNLLQRELREPTTIIMADGVKVVDVGKWNRQFQATGQLPPTGYLPRE